MLRFYTLAFTALAASLLASCERTAQPVSKAAPLPESPQIGLPVSQSAELPAASNSVESVRGDSLIVSDTAGNEFTAEDLKAVKSALEARLRLDEFTASGPAARHGNACRFYDTTSVRRYTTDDVRFAYVRPRLLQISFAGDDHYVRLVNAVAEVTRLVLLRQGVAGKWKGAVDVARDTVSLLVSSSVADSTWTVCEKPAHANGRDRDGVENPYVPWLPVRASDMEQMPVAWDEHFDAEKLRQLADSVSKLPASFVVEGNRPPSVPIVIKDVCPFEGCEFGEWLTCDTLRAFTEASDTPKPAFMLHRGDRFTALTGDVHIAQAGMVVFHRNVAVDEEDEVNFVFTPADTLYPLLATGEGYGSWYFRGKERPGVFFFGNGHEAESRPERGYSVVRPIKSVWWVKLRTKDGREGWFVPRGGRIHGIAPHYEPLPDACPIRAG